MISHAKSFTSILSANRPNSMTHEVVWDSNWLIANYFCSLLSTHHMMSNYYNKRVYRTDVDESGLRGLISCFIYWVNNPAQIEPLRGKEGIILPDDATYGIMKCHEFIHHLKNGYNLVYAYSVKD